MDQSYSESDVSLSPTQILERLRVLRELQILQRGKLQKQRLEYHEAPEQSPSISGLISQISSSTSYNTFKSLLQFSCENSEERQTAEPITKISPKLCHKDLVEGVSMLNLSQESEFIINSPISSSNRSYQSEQPLQPIRNKNSGTVNTKKHIELDEMPILTPKKDFESLLLEKIKKDKTKTANNVKPNKTSASNVEKKPFLKRGEGMARFGLKKNDLVIQHTKSLPWKNKRDNDTMPPKNKVQIKSNLKRQEKIKKDDKIQVQFLIPESEKNSENDKEINDHKHNRNDQIPVETETKLKINASEVLSKPNTCQVHSQNATTSNNLHNAKNKHPLLANKGKTWAAILTQEQDDFLRQLKQSDYYKNYTSPAKSTVSDMSCDETLNRVRLEREVAEQNMFELLENKVGQDNFNMENSFFSRFLRQSQLECSGDSTPLVFQKCLNNNPELLHIFPPPQQKAAFNGTQSYVESNSEYTDCDHETCSSASSCCSCKTVDESNNTTVNDTTENAQSNLADNNKTKNKLPSKQAEKRKGKEIDEHNVTVTETDDLKANIVEMNEKLVATSELLKERLNELEDEINTFRKENSNLNKMREEMDAERHKFYEEKSVFEQKYNEERVLSEYYLSEEKEKLTKQKQTYERYIREMRGRLNKKEKDDVLNLKKEIRDLKEEIRIKDAKTTSTIARLRNHIKILEREKKEADDECEKLKKENRRIQHSNEITRRLSNIKYLEEINRKLSVISTKDSKSEVDVDNDIKYKAFEIERQGRSYRMKALNNNPVRKRAKSVPNLNVTSRYAKYFSQRDVVSQMERNNTLNIDRVDIISCLSDNELNNGNKHDNLKLNLDTSDQSIKDIDTSDSEEENNLEKIYTERFKSLSPDNSPKLASSKSEYNIPSTSRPASNEESDSFFLRKSSSSSTVSSTNRSKQYQHSQSSESRSKSPMSILSNKSAANRKSPTVVEVDVHKENSSQEPLSSSSLAKTNLNPTEIKRPDGTRELRFPNGNVKYISADGDYTKFTYYNGDVKETFHKEGRVKYFYVESKTYHSTYADGLEVLEFPDGQVEKRYRDGSTEIRLPNGSVRYCDPKSSHVREEWRFPDGTVVSVAASGEQVVCFTNGQREVHAKDHKRREFPDGTVKLVYSDGTSETRYSSGRIRVKDKHGNLILDSAPR